MKKNTNSRLDAVAASSTNQWPLLLSLAVFAAGVVVVWVGFWRLGSFIVAGALVAAGVLRWSLPSRLAGLLVVRTRVFDVTILLGMAIFVVLLAVLVPAVHG